jgi:major intracellular serine protease
MKINVIKNLNIRRAPDTTLPKIGIILAGNEIEVEGIVTGESINGNAKWYYDKSLNYYWSGGTDLRPPAPVTALPSERPALFVNYNDWAIKSNPLLKNYLKEEAIRVAVLDSGIYEAHPDFIHAFDLKNFPSEDYTQTSGPIDIKGHGTHVAGLIGARSNENVGIIGVAPKCILQNIKVIDDRGNSSGDALLAALKKINSSANIDIINLSLNITYKEYKQIENLLEEVSRTAIIVASAGTNAALCTEGDILYPAISPYVISVGAVSKEFLDMNPAPRFNNRVDFIFPEIPLTSCAVKEKYFYQKDFGSSMSVALLSGIIAVIIERADNKSPETIKTILNEIAKPYSPNLNINSLTLIKP